MKINKTILWTGAVVAAAFLTQVPVASAEEMSPELTAALQSVPAAEMPAKAAALVRQARAEERQNQAVLAVRSAIQVNPAATPAVVGAIVGVAEETAAKVSAAAAAAQPEQAFVIARVAAMLAPKQADKIAFAVCKVVPGDYAKIAASVVQAVPSSEKKVMKAVVAAVPNVKTFMDRAGVSADIGLPLAVVLDKTQRQINEDARGLKVTPEEALVKPASDLVFAAPSSASSRAALATVPTVGPPFTPAGSNVGEIDRNDTTEIAPGSGRNYSKP